MYGKNIRSFRDLSIGNRRVRVKELDARDIQSFSIDPMAFGCAGKLPSVPAIIAKEKIRIAPKSQ